MFLNLNRHDPDRIAVKDDSGYNLSYSEVCSIISRFERLKLPRCVVFCLCENCAGSLVGYLAFENNGQVPLLLNANMDKELRSGLEQTYLPSYYWIPERKAEEISGEKLFAACGYILVKRTAEPCALHEKLSLLLTTSGSTGSPKLVRHKYGNLESNAVNVAKAFSWTVKDKGICDLPMNYTMGLNVINSYLVTGATVLMVRANLTDPCFWEFIKANEGTGFCGVPFSYEVLRRVGFEKMNLPRLYTLAEGGGKLTDKMFEWIAAFCRNSGKRFCATFGTSETSARMSFLDPSLALKKIGSIGKPIPGGEMFLLDEVRNEDGTVSGELGYRGPNVTMGYAYCREDLLKGDEFCGEFHTGDIAKRDKDGFYFIIGRKGRFLKLFGLRVSLDETEQILKTQYPAVDFVCTGDDKRMSIFITDAKISEEVVPFISKKIAIHSSAFRVYIVNAIPRNESGKVSYAALEKIARQINGISKL